MTQRIRWLTLVMVLCFVMLFLQLNNLQVVKAHGYATAAGNPNVIAAEYSRPRGVIDSADGVVLAQSVPNPDAKSPFRFVRQYPPPWGPLFSHVVGDYSFNYAPQGGYGVEGSYDKYLVSHNAPIKTLGDLLTTRIVVDTVTLTISTRMQQAAAQALGSNTGAVVALDPTTGAILAMYSNPTYDPNPLASPDSATETAAWEKDTSAPAGDFAPLLALAYERAFPPGSTFKTITTSAVYDHDPQLLGKYYGYRSCTNLPYTDKVLCNFHKEGCGGTIVEMLPPSCDTGFALVGLDLGGNNLYDEASSFGFDSIPPIDLPTTSYSKSNFPTPPQFTENQPGVAYSAIGQQDVAANALQMAMVAGAIGNGGVMMTPHVVFEVRDSQGNLVTRYQPTPWRVSTSPKTAGSVRDLMVKVAQYGTASGVFPSADKVAAKTGTAETNNGASTTDWMIAFAPADHPQVAVAVVIPGQPGGISDYTGAAIAGPVARAMLEAVITSTPGQR